MITEQELSAIEARAAKATAGKWVKQKRWFYHGNGPGWWTWDVTSTKGPTTYPCGMKEADADLCAKGHQDVPALCAEVRRLRKALRGISMLPFCDSYMAKGIAKQAINTEQEPSPALVRQGRES